MGAARSAPFLSDAAKIHSFTNPAQWSDFLAKILHFTSLTARAGDTSAYKAISSITELGEIRIAAMESPAAVLISSYEHEHASIYMPYRGRSIWSEGQTRSILQSGEGALYIPPGAKAEVEADEFTGVLTLVNKTALIEKAVLMSRGSISLGQINGRIKTAKQFAAEKGSSGHLTKSLYNCYRLLDGVFRAGEDALRYIPLDDTFLRIVTLLLFPEIRSRESRGQAAGDKLTLLRELETWIIDNLDKRITMTDLEIRCNYSQRSIQSYFNNHYGMSPKQWIIKQRMKKAFTMLTEDPLMSISLAAKDCGYYDPSRFSKHFEKEYGISPKDCRKARLQSEPD